MSPELLPSDLSEWVALGAVLFAGGQFVYAPRRDLGSVTLGLAGSAGVLSMPEGSTFVAIALTTALLIATAAWFRAGRHGVGRPALNGLAVATVSTCALAPMWLPALDPNLDSQQLQNILLMPCLFVTMFCGLLALERPGPRRTRIHWIGRIHIEEPEPPVSEAPS